MTSSVSLKWAVGIIVSEAGDEPDLKVTMQLQDKGYKFYELPKVSNSVKMTVYTLPDWLASRPASIADVYPRLASYVKVCLCINIIQNVNKYIRYDKVTKKLRCKCVMAMMKYLKS